MRSLKRRQKHRKIKRRTRSKHVQNGGAGIKTFLATLFLGLFLRTNTQNEAVDINKLIDEYIANQPPSMIGESSDNFIKAWENMTGLNYCPPAILNARDAERLRERQVETARQFKKDPGAGAGYVFGGPSSTFGTSMFPSEREREITLKLKKSDKGKGTKRSRSDDEDRDIVQSEIIDRRLVEMTCNNDELLEYIKNELKIEDDELAEYNDELRDALDRLNRERINGKLDLSIPTTLGLIHGIINILSKIYRLASRKGDRKEKSITDEQKIEILNKLKEINPDLFVNLSDDVIIDLLGVGLGSELIESASQAPTLQLSQGSVDTSHACAHG